ncbi:YNL195C and HBT1 (YDL223C) [Zygosaccharomyces parabailii]|nr:YNL195C and HBT1 (YDL223C) [Zygosaccharomyces parabailii]
MDTHKTEYTRTAIKTKTMLFRKFKKHDSDNAGDESNEAVRRAENDPETTVQEGQQEGRNLSNKGHLGGTGSAGSHSAEAGAAGTGPTPPTPPRGQDSDEQYIVEQSYEEEEYVPSSRYGTAASPRQGAPGVQSTSQNTSRGATSYSTSKNNSKDVGSSGATSGASGVASDHPEYQDRSDRHSHSKKGFSLPFMKGRHHKQEEEHDHAQEHGTTTGERGQTHPSSDRHDNQNSRAAGAAAMGTASRSRGATSGSTNSAPLGGSSPSGLSAGVPAGPGTNSAAMAGAGAAAQRVGGPGTGVGTGSGFNSNSNSGYGSTTSTGAGTGAGLHQDPSTGMHGKGRSENQPRARASSDQGGKNSSTRHSKDVSARDNSGGTTGVFKRVSGTPGATTTTTTVITSDTTTSNINQGSSADSSNLGGKNTTSSTSGDRGGAGDYGFASRTSPSGARDFDYDKIEGDFPEGTQKYEHRGPATATSAAKKGPLSTEEIEPRAAAHGHGSHAYSESYRGGYQAGYTAARSGGVPVGGGTTGSAHDTTKHSPKESQRGHGEEEAAGFGKTAGHSNANALGASGTTGPSTGTTEPSTGTTRTTRITTTSTAPSSSRAGTAVTTSSAAKSSSSSSSSSSKYGGSGAERYGAHDPSYQESRGEHTGVLGGTEEYGYGKGNKPSDQFGGDDFSREEKPGLRHEEHHHHHVPGAYVTDDRDDDGAHYEPAGYRKSTASQLGPGSSEYPEDYDDMRNPGSGPLGTRRSEGSARKSGAPPPLAVIDPANPKLSENIDASARNSGPKVTSHRAIGGGARASGYGDEYAAKAGGAYGDSSQDVRPPKYSSGDRDDEHDHDRKHDDSTKNSSSGNAGGGNYYRRTEYYHSGPGEDQSALRPGTSDSQDDRGLWGQEGKWGQEESLGQAAGDQDPRTATSGYHAKSSGAREGSPSGSNYYDSSEVAPDSQKQTAAERATSKKSVRKEQEPVMKRPLSKNQDTSVPRLGFEGLFGRRKSSSSGGGSEEPGKMDSFVRRLSFSKKKSSDRSEPSETTTTEYYQEEEMEEETGQQPLSKTKSSKSSKSRKDSSSAEPISPRLKKSGAETSSPKTASRKSVSGATSPRAKKVQVPETRSQPQMQTQTQTQSYSGPTPTRESPTQEGKRFAETFGNLPSLIDPNVPTYGFGTRSGTQDASTAKPVASVEPAETSKSKFASMGKSSPSAGGGALSGSAGGDTGKTSTRSKGPMGLGGTSNSSAMPSTSYSTSAKRDEPSSHSSKPYEPTYPHTGAEGPGGNYVASSGNTSLGRTLSVESDDSQHGRTHREGYHHYAGESPVYGEHQHQGYNESTVPRAGVVDDEELPEGAEHAHTGKEQPGIFEKIKHTIMPGSDDNTTAV